MTFSLYSAQLFRYDGALSLHSTRERLCLRMTSSRTHRTLKMMLWVVMVRGASQKTFVRLGEFPIFLFLSVRKICLLYNVGKETPPICDGSPKHEVFCINSLSFWFSSGCSSSLVRFGSQLWFTELKTEPCVFAIIF